MLVGSTTRMISARSSLDKARRLTIVRLCMLFFSFDHENEFVDKVAVHTSDEQDRDLCDIVAADWEVYLVECVR